MVVLVALSVAVLNFKNMGRMLYPLKYENYILAYSKEYNVDPMLVAAVIRAESNFKVEAKSNKDAYGLMQITPETAKWSAEKMKLQGFKVEDLYKPETNIKIGCWYLNNLGEEFNGNPDLVLAAYNGGRGNVRKWLKEAEHSEDGVNLHYIPFPETDKYVKKVKVNYNIYKYLYGEKIKKSKAVGKTQPSDM